MIRLNIIGNGISLVSKTQNLYLKKHQQSHRLVFTVQFPYFFLKLCRERCLRVFNTVKQELKMFKGKEQNVIKHLH